MNHEDIIGKHERTFGEITQGLTDIQNQIRQNSAEAIARRKEDHESESIWRSRIEARIINVELAIAEIQPNYRRILGAMGFVAAGCVTATAAFIWNHVTGSK